MGGLSCPPFPSLSPSLPDRVRVPALPPSCRPIPRRFAKDERSNSIIVLVSFTSVSYYLQFCFVWVTPSPVFFPPCYPRELRADCSQCSVTGCHPTEPAAASCPKTPLSFPREAILSPFPLLARPNERHRVLPQLPKSVISPKFTFPCLERLQCPTPTLPHVPAGL